MRQPKILLILQNISDIHRKAFWVPVLRQILRHKAKFTGRESTELILNVCWRYAALFDLLLFCTWYRQENSRRITLLLYGGLVGWMLLILIYKVKVSGGIYSVSPTGLEPMLRTSEALMAKYLNVRQRKLGTVNIQTVHSVQHDSAITGSLPNGEVLHGQPNILPINLARQW